MCRPTVSDWRWQKVQRLAPPRSACVAAQRWMANVTTFAACPSLLSFGNCLQCHDTPSADVQADGERLAAAEGATVGAAPLRVRGAGTPVAQRVPACCEGGVDGFRQTDAAQPAGRGFLAGGRGFCQLLSTQAPPCRSTVGWIIHFAEFCRIAAAWYILNWQRITI